MEQNFAEKFVLLKIDASELVPIFSDIIVGIPSIGGNSFIYSFEISNLTKRDLSEHYLKKTNGNVEQKFPLAYLYSVLGTSKR